MAVTYNDQIRAVLYGTRPPTIN